MQSDPALYDAIRSGEFDHELFELKAEIDRRMNVLSSRNLFPGMGPGDKVRFKADTRPMKLAGRTATIVHTNGRGRNRIVVDLDQPVGTWKDGIRCQPSHIEPIAA